MIVSSGDASDRLLPITSDTAVDEVRAIVAEWAEHAVPIAWRDAGRRGGPSAVRTVRTATDYAVWYPTLAEAGLVAPMWPRRHGGLGVEHRTARAIEEVLAPFNLGRLNVLGLNLAGPTILRWGTDEQQDRFLSPIVRNDEVWCQLFSEPSAGSDLASLATRAVADGDEWVVTGAKVWTTWAHVADFGLLLARSDPAVPKRAGISYFLCDLRGAGVEVRPLRHLTGEVDFNEVFLDEVRIPDAHRLGPVGGGWEVARTTLSGERQMIAGPGSGGVSRIGGSGVRAVLEEARRRADARLPGGADDPVVRQRLARLWSEERIRTWTNARVRDNSRAGRVGPESSVGKVAAGELNQAIQVAAVDLRGPDAAAWDGAELPHAVRGFLRSRANTIEGGTSEVNRTVIGERVLELPREPDPWRDAPWQDVPRS